MTARTFPYTGRMRPPLLICWTVGREGNNGDGVSIEDRGEAEEQLGRETYRTPHEARCMRQRTLQTNKRNSWTTVRGRVQQRG